MSKKYALIIVFISIINLKSQNFSVTDIVELATIQKNGNNNKDIPLLALVNEGFDSTHFTMQGFKVGSFFSNILTFRIQPNQISKLKDFKGIDYIQIARKIDPKLSKSIPDIRADSVYKGYGLNTGYTGKNVIIGITDWGFDYTHPMFYDTSMQYTRILAAWDQFKKSGPAPANYHYGTEYVGEAALLNAKSDTANIYDYATHGSHVAGIAGGGGAGTIHKGVAFEANYLMVTFLVDEAAVIDAYLWMKAKADAAKKRLVINMSWGLHHFGTLDGNSLLSRVIDSLSAKGVVFVASGGNNGDVNFHIKKQFNKDTLKSLISFYDYSAHAKMYGQSISAWGEKMNNFSIGFDVYNSNQKLLYKSTWYNTQTLSKYIDTFDVIGLDTVFYNLSMAKAHPLNQKPHARLRIKNKNTSLFIALKSSADAGVVHYWNVTELTNDVGNWGMPFTAFLSNWTVGDNKYGISEPATTKSAITVAAHNAEFKRANGTLTGGTIATFSSNGPTVDGRQKPDVSAPGVSVASSISSFTTNSYTLLQNVKFNGKDYPFARFSGTSMSAPTTSGVIALILSANSKLTAAQVKEILIKTARIDKITGVLPDSGSTIWGHGKVNALAAVKMAEQLRLNSSINTNELILYPNPSNHSVQINNFTDSIYQIEIYSSLGQLVLKQKVSYNSAINIQTFSNGLYFLKMIGTKTKTFKMDVIN